jgi:hypothetical protein
VIRTGPIAEFDQMIDNGSDPGKFREARMGKLQASIFESIQRRDPYFPSAGSDETAL